VTWRGSSFWALALDTEKAWFKELGKQVAVQHGCEYYVLKNSATVAVVVVDVDVNFETGKYVLAFIIIIASWDFPLMSNAPIINVFHILQLWTSHVFFIVVSHSGRSCAFLANVLTSSPPQSEMSCNHFLTVFLVGYICPFHQTLNYYFQLP